MTVALVVVSHSEKIADGAAELAAQMAPDVSIATAGGTTDGRIGTSLEKVMAALEQAAGADGVVILTDLGSAVMTAESALEFAGEPDGVLLAHAPLVEGLVAAAVAAQGGADVHAVKRAAEAVYGSATGVPPSSSLSAVEEGSVTGAGPEFTGDFELINQAGMHARPAAKIAGGLSSLDARVTVNGLDGTSMTALMTLAAGKGSVLHVEAWGLDAERAVNYVGGLVQAGFGEP
ncbi:dihydroxyacetone kinase phosphoryl donor subunit DhaM [Arthrobacter sp. HS15c]|uniref:dihydroxyacetone kinase phosphoryl donor subunit DhaM n=1 Tax=Arthrobacter sp. HS15c TaxID=3230279 RepID=UPI003466DF11